MEDPSKCILLCLAGVGFLTDEDLTHRIWSENGLCSFKASGSTFKKNSSQFAFYPHLSLQSMQKQHTCTHTHTPCSSSSSIKDFLQRFKVYYQQCLIIFWSTSWKWDERQTQNFHFICFNCRTFQHQQETNNNKCISHHCGAAWSTSQWFYITPP